MKGNGEALELDRARDAAHADARFVDDLGRRIRDLRERRGLSRRQLALHADVSERYLGQIETGNGNITVVLLRRVAAALGVAVADLLASEAVDREAARRTRIALIGLRGAGKSTLGALLGDALRIPLIELNGEVTRETGLPVGDVMALYGLAEYRRVERRVLERVAREHARVVITAGGGIVHDEEAFDFLLANCCTIWIRATPEEHMARVLAQGDLRPMAGNPAAMDELRRILAAREAMYRKADIAIDTSGETPQASFAKLRNAIAPAFGEAGNRRERKR